MLSAAEAATHRHAECIAMRLGRGSETNTCDSSRSHTTAKPSFRSAALVCVRLVNIPAKPDLSSTLFRSTHSHTHSHTPAETTRRIDAQFRNQFRCSIRSREKVRSLCPTNGFFARQSLSNTMFTRSYTIDQQSKVHLSSPLRLLASGGDSFNTERRRFHRKEY